MCGIPYTLKVGIAIYKTVQFDRWYQKLDPHTQRIVDGRLERIQNESHFGTVNRFEGLTELKWKSGMRIYCAEQPPQLLILVGGNKNGQDKDIRNAKKILGEINETRSVKKPK